MSASSAASRPTRTWARELNLVLPTFSHLNERILHAYRPHQPPLPPLVILSLFFCIPIDSAQMLLRRHRGSLRRLWTSFCVPSSLLVKENSKRILEFFGQSLGSVSNSSTLRAVGIKTRTTKPSQIIQSIYDPFLLHNLAKIHSDPSFSCTSLYNSSSFGADKSGLCQLRRQRAWQSRSIGDLNPISSRRLYISPPDLQWQFHWPQIEILLPLHLPLSTR